MEYIKIGAVAGTHGLQGELNVKPLTQFTDIRFQAKSTIYLETEQGMQALKIKAMRMHKDRVLLMIEGYTHINQVEAWKGKQLYIKTDQLHELEEDEIYFFDLMDCQVEDIHGLSLGNVVDVMDTGANAVLRVRGERELLIPYVKAFVKETDKDAKKIVVELLEGMV